MASYSNGNGNGAYYTPANSALQPSKLRQNYPHFGDDSSLIDDCVAAARRSWRSLLRFCSTKGKKASWALLLETMRQLRRNMSTHRLVSIPHVLVLIWVLVMLWGERWVFHTTVERCRWGNWEKWVR